VTRRTMLLMLEDNAERVGQFLTVWNRVAPRQAMQVWHTAPEMIRGLPNFLPAARLISLDHDLELAENNHPGDGMDVVRFLATLRPACPVIVHTNNADRGTLMMEELELAGWKRRRVYPVGDDWIEKRWIRAVHGLLRRSSTRG
jgi:Cyclic-phosphate processing Receiver domain